MSRLKRLKTNFIIWLLIVAIGLSLLGCNSSNHLTRQLIPTEKATAGVNVCAWRDETSEAIPVAANKNHRDRRTSNISDTLNGFGETLGKVAKFSADVAVVGVVVEGCVIGGMYLDYQVWRLQDKMF